MSNIKDSICKRNASFWDQESLAQRPWSQPVSTDIIAAAKRGDWLTVIKRIHFPIEWLPKNLVGKEVLCLASAGGQQAPVLAAAGANVTVYDISEKQLALDKLVADRDGLTLTIIQGEMGDLSVFPDDSFDYIFNPISNAFTPDVKSVWQECYRVLRNPGMLLATFYNPILFVFERNRELNEPLKPKFTLPYSNFDSAVHSEGVVFGHSLSDQINGQLEAGFMLTGFHERKSQSPRFSIEKYVPTIISTKAEKRSA